MVRARMKTLLGTSAPRNVQKSSWIAIGHLFLVNIGSAGVDLNQEAFLWVIILRLMLTTIL